MAKTWTVFAPGQSKVVIKHEGKYFFYRHGEVLDKEEPFFANYTRIFKATDDGLVQTVAPKDFKLEIVSLVANPEPECVMGESTEESIENIEFVIEEATKGWFIVTHNGSQVFPEAEGKKCRKAAAEQYIEENS